MAPSLTETLPEGARPPVIEVSDWERDQEAWNLPRARRGAIARGADEHEHDARESDPGERAADPPPLSPETTG